MPRWPSCLSLAENDYSRLVENKEEHIEGVDREEGIALPLLEPALNDRGNYRNGASGDADREVEDEVYSVNGESLAVDNRAEGKDKGGVDDIRAYDVSDREGVLLLADCGQGRNKLGKRSSESNNGKSDNRLADAYTRGDGLSGGNEELGAEDDRCRAENESI